MRHQIERALKRATFVIEGYQGQLVRHQGGEMLALFPEVEDAIISSCEMVSRIAQLPPVLGTRLSLRVGLQCGEAEISGDTLIGEAVAIASGLLGQAAPGQILAGHRTLSALQPGLRHVLRPIVLRPDQGAAHDSAVLEVICQGVAGGRIIPSAPLEPEPQLRLTNDRHEFLLDASSRGLSLGRDPECDVLIHDPRASRRHAWIGHRKHGFILADSSTNGTFVTFADGSEHMVKHAELPLSGNGNIAFGEDFDEGPRDVFQFEIHEK
ncbi:MAG: FHA domain-containing protein [Rhodocyclaceae bacterium]|nr:FHA domain-containing protein [Rhodocyclaceae bacterium]